MADLSKVNLTDRHQAILRVEAITGYTEYEHPEAAIGESDSDYPDYSGDGNGNVKCSSIEEVENFYDTGRPEDIKLL